MGEGAELLTAATALGGAVVAGVFLAFSGFVMAALASLRPDEGIRAMQAINVEAVTAPLMIAMFGTAAGAVAVGVIGAADPGSGHGPWLLAGALLYLAGVIGVTMAANVPRNDALADLDPAAPGAEAEWERYVREWTRWNGVRAVAGFAAAAALLAALLG